MPKPKAPRNSWRQQPRSNASLSPAAEPTQPSSSTGATSSRQPSPVQRPHTPSPVTLHHEPGNKELPSSLQPQPAAATPHEVKLPQGSAVKASVEAAAPSPGAGKRKVAARRHQRGQHNVPSPRKKGASASPVNHQASLKALNTLLDEHATPASNTDSTARMRRQMAYYGCRSVHCAVIFVVALFAVLVVFIAYLRLRSLRVAVELCRTDSCYAYRQRLSTQLDNSVDPCDNFAAYVCGHWKPEKQFGDLSHSTFADMVMTWRNGFHDILEKGAANLPIGRKAVTMYESCMTQSQPDIRTFHEFVRAHGLAWPEAAGGRPPLEILFDLAFNWDMNLWFRLELLPGTENDTRRRLLITANEYVSYWDVAFEQIPEGKFATLYNAMVIIFGGDKSKLVSENKTKEVYKTMRSVLRVLVRAGTRMVHSPALFPLRDLKNYTDLLSAEHVLDVINKTVKINPPFRVDELLVFNDIELLHAMLGIISRYDDSTLLSHLSWLFVYANGAVADPAAVLHALHGSTEWATAERPRYCAVQVEASYKILVAALAAVTVFSKEERSTINEHLGAVQQLAAQKASSALWLDKKTKRRAMRKLRRVRTRLWPAPQFFTGEVLERTYGKFPDDNDTSFTKLWVETRRIGRQLLGTRAGAFAQSLMESTALPYVRLSIGALAPPLYYPEGTKSMLYGGLGYFYAKNLIQAVDTAGAKVDAQGRIVSSWLSQASQPEFERRVHDCLEENATVFPEVPAMEVAHAAFQQHRLPNDSRLSMVLRSAALKVHSHRRRGGKAAKRAFHRGKAASARTCSDRSAARAAEETGHRALLTTCAAISWHS
ncbi:hypothetical protein HPB50_014922 [Hyalomma asiaticum]|uniref:Uncharacterized protein n=1 Tax=Hyalomma asiaticum TaxID=266040 RepID=A0ACB7T800_HYAAI|nr:hypothetical protein HPB50_014922 [Hyalomma asiaticum]